MVDLLFNILLTSNNVFIILVPNSAIIISIMLIVYLTHFSRSLHARYLCTEVPRYVALFLVPFCGNSRAFFLILIAKNQVLFLIRCWFSYVELTNLHKFNTFFSPWTISFFYCNISSRCVFTSYQRQLKSSFFTIFIKSCNCSHCLIND